MNGRFLLDTSILIAIFAGDPYVREHLTQPGEIFVPIVALGELYYAVAQQHGLTVVSRDAHFEEVDNLSLER